MLFITLGLCTHPTDTLSLDEDGCSDLTNRLGRRLKRLGLLGVEYKPTRILAISSPDMYRTYQTKRRQLPGICSPHGQRHFRLQPPHRWAVILIQTSE
ncbi:hypothetical protein BJX64DRAFT_249452 [Aspergillus heterothallicus]